MNIFLINHYAGSQKHGMEYRPYYFAKEWVKKENNVCIAASSFSHVRILQPEVKNKIASEVINGISYCWIKSPRYKGNGVKRFINIISFVTGLFKYSNFFKKKFSSDVVIASSTYPLDIFPAYRLAKKTGAVLVYEVHDLWPLSLIELGNMSKYHPLIVLFQLAENFAYKNSAKVVSILPYALSYMEQHGLKKDKFIYIPNGINIEDWQKEQNIPFDKIEKILELKQNGQFLIAYTGAHGIANALDAFIKAATKVKHLPIKLLLIGDGPEKEKLISLAESLNSSNVIFMEPVSRNAIPNILEKMDVLFIGLQNKPIFRFGISPNKLLDYMMAGKPVIQAINAGNDLVTEAGCGITVEAENIDAIAEAMVQLFQMTQEEREKMGSAGREYVIRFHNYEKLAEKFLDSIPFDK